MPRTTGRIQRKLIKYNHLVANCLIFHNVQAQTRILHQLAAEGYPVDEAVLARLSPYLTAHVNRFGQYMLDFYRQVPPPDYTLTSCMHWQRESRQSWPVLHNWLPSTDYIQHSAHIEPGREGLFNLVKSLPPTLKYEPGTIVAEGDVVIVHGRFSGFGLPVNWIAADMLRIENEMLVEHWDVIQDEATRASSKSGLPMFGDTFRA